MPVKNLVEPVTLSIGQTFANIWYLVFGGFTKYQVDKREIKYRLGLKAFEESCLRELEAIPASKRVEPDTQVIYNALEDARPCVENETLREMFAKLISASTNVDTSSLVHPSFSGSLRRMSTVDALNLRLFQVADILPIVKYAHILDSGGMRIVTNNVFISNPDYQDIAQQATSIACLESLGLLATDYTSWIHDGKAYEPFYNLGLYRATKGFVDTFKPQDRPAFLVDVKEITINKGMVQATALGKQFIAVCCPA